ATVVNPADGTTLSDSRTVTVLPGSSDAEPNDTASAASLLAFGRTINGTLDGASDLRDVYRVEPTTDGAVTVRLSIPETTGLPGTAVTIDGSGFSTELRENLVFFGVTAAKVTSASPTQLEALVPANAVDGPVRVVVRSRAVTGPPFATSNAAPPPPITMQPRTEHLVRFHPGNGALVDLQRLLVRFD